jgi:hypothetical protein
MKTDQTIRIVECSLPETSDSKDQILGDLTTLIDLFL